MSSLTSKSTIYIDEEGFSRTRRSKPVLIVTFEITSNFESSECSLSSLLDSENTSCKPCPSYLGSALTFLELRINDYETYQIVIEEFNSELKKYLIEKPIFAEEDLKRIEEEIKKYLEAASIEEFFYFSTILYSYYYKKYPLLPYSYKERFNKNAISAFKVLISKLEVFPSNKFSLWFLSFFNLFISFFGEKERDFSSETNFYLSLMEKVVEEKSNQFEEKLLEFKRDFNLAQELWLYQKRKFKRLKEALLECSQASNCNTKGS
jgi:hypothetical protein